MLFLYVWIDYPILLSIQVTNPAIDSLREGLVMSLEINLGKRGNILDAGAQNAAQVCIVVFWSS